MLTEKQFQNYADVLLWGLEKAKTKKYKKNDIILIRADLGAIRLAEILHQKLLQKGMNPIVRFSSTPLMERDFFELANTSLNLSKSSSRCAAVTVRRNRAAPRGTVG